MNKYLILVKRLGSDNANHILKTVTGTYRFNVEHTDSVNVTGSSQLQRRVRQDKWLETTRGGD